MLKVCKVPVLSNTETSSCSVLVQYASYLHIGGGVGNTREGQLRHTHFATKASSEMRDESSNSEAQ